MHASGATVEDTGDAGGSGRKYAATDAEGSAVIRRPRGRAGVEPRARTTGRTRRAASTTSRRRSRGPSTLDVLADASGYRPADVVTALHVLRSSGRARFEIVGGKSRMDLPARTGPQCVRADVRGRSGDVLKAYVPGLADAVPGRADGPASRWSARTPWRSWLFGLSWARSEADRRGHPREVLPVLHPLCGRPVAEVAAALVASGLWAETEEGLENRGLRGLNPNGAEDPGNGRRPQARVARAGKAKREAAKTGGLLSPVAPSETKPVRVASAGRPTGRTPDEVRIEIEKEILLLHKGAGALSVRRRPLPQPSRVPVTPAAELLGVEAAPPLPPSRPPPRRDLGRPVPRQGHEGACCAGCAGRPRSGTRRLRRTRAARGARNPWPARQRSASTHARAPSSVRADASRPYQRPPPARSRQGCDLPAGIFEGTACAD